MPRLGCLSWQPSQSQPRTAIKQEVYEDSHNVQQLAHISIRMWQKRAFVSWASLLRKPESSLVDVL